MRTIETFSDNRIDEREARAISLNQPLSEREITLAKAALRYAIDACPHKARRAGAPLPLARPADIRAYLNSAESMLVMHPADRMHRVDLIMEHIQQRAAIEPTDAIPRAEGSVVLAYPHRIDGSDRYVIPLGEATRVKTMSGFRNRGL